MTLKEREIIDPDQGDKIILKKNMDGIRNS
jgi:hypothetical protein